MPFRGFWEKDGDPMDGFPRLLQSIWLYGRARTASAIFRAGHCVRGGVPFVGGWGSGGVSG